MGRLLTSLAYQSLIQAQKLTNNHDAIEQAWEIYLKITRYSPGCTKKEFLDWAYSEQQKEVLV